MDSTAIILARAASAYKAGRIAEAEAICDGLLSSDDESIGPRKLLALIQAASGRHRLALANFDRAIQQQPNDPELLNNRGVCLRRLRRFADALASYDRALAIRPDYAQAHHNRGNTLRALGRYAEAVASFEKALSHSPENAPILYCLGLTFRAMRRFDEALSTYDRVIAIAPDHVNAHINRSVTLRDLGRLEEALAAIDQVLAIRPGHPEAHNNKGALLKELGRIGNARASIEKAIELAPTNSLFYLNVASAKTFTIGDLHLEAMKRLHAELRAKSEEDWMVLQFALAKAYGDIGEYDESFRHLLWGNAAKRRRLTYDETSTLQLFQRIGAVFTSDILCAKSNIGHPSSAPIFIVGMPRSGSTLIEQILASHPKVFGGGELPHFANAVATNLYPLPFPEAVASKADTWFREVGASYVKSVSTLMTPLMHITDKQLMNFGFIGLINLALPNARIIHTYRDPIDTCLSCFATLFANGHPFTYDLGELGRYYNGYRRMMDHWRRVLPHNVMLEVRYEDVVDDVAHQSRRLLDHCGLEWNDACLAFYATKRPVQSASATQVRQPIYRSSVTRPRPSRDLLEPLLNALGDRTSLVSTA